MADLPQPSLDETIEFSVAGRRFAMSGAEVLAKARQAIRQGVPPSAQTYLAWAVAVDGQLVGLKWLFSLATGLPRSTFVSNQALYSFERMGLDVQRVADVPAPGQGERQALDVPRVAGGKRPTAAAKQRSEPASGGPHAVLDREIAQVLSFLRGRSSRPSDEKLCDWVHFCYNFGHFAEGRDLFRVVDPSQVHPWYYERTRRLARVCDMKARGQA